MDADCAENGFFPPEKSGSTGKVPPHTPGGGFGAAPGALREPGKGVGLDFLAEN